MTDSYKYSEERRRDPKLLERCKRVKFAQMAKLSQASKTLRTLRDELWSVKVRGYYDSQFEDSLSEVSSAAYVLDRTSSFLNHLLGDGEDHETYYGNMAASQEGEIIARMSDEEFDKQFPKDMTIG